MAASPGAVSNLNVSTTTSNDVLLVGLEDLADEHDRELEKLLSEDTEDIPDNALELDRFDSPGRSSDVKVVAQQEYSSPDDVRTMMELEHQDPLDPKNLDDNEFVVPTASKEAVRSANTSATEHN